MKLKGSFSFNQTIFTKRGYIVNEKGDSSPDALPNDQTLSIG